MYVAVLGYGGPDRDQPQVVSLLDAGDDAFAQQPWTISISQVWAQEGGDVVDGTRQFIRSNPGGWTPMAAAIRRAGTIINEWVSTYLASNGGTENPRFPLPAPVIMNVSDGVPTDDEYEWGPVERWAELLNTGSCYPLGSDGKPIMLLDGPPLLINIGTPASDGASPAQRLVFPTEQELPPAGSTVNEGIRRLWHLASPMHPNLVATALTQRSEATGLSLLPPGATHHGRRLYASGGSDWDLLKQIFIWGSDPLGGMPH